MATFLVTYYGGGGPPASPEAVSVVKSHPFIGRGGTLQVSEAVSP